jgi:hypothetical protein
MKLQQQFVKTLSRVDIEELDETTGGSGSHGPVSAEVATRERSELVKTNSKSPLKRKASTSPRFKYSFRCEPELYKHTIPFVVNDSEWNVEFYDKHGKFPLGYDSLQFKRAIYTRRAYAFIISQNPNAQIPDTFVMIRTVMQRCDVHLHTRNEPLDFESILKVLSTPKFVFALYNDPHLIYEHGYRPRDNDYTMAQESCGSKTIDDGVNRPLYRICNVGGDTDSACVLLVYESNLTLQMSATAGATADTSGDTGRVSAPAGATADVSDGAGRAIAIADVSDGSGRAIASSGATADVSGGAARASASSGATADVSGGAARASASSGATADASGGAARASASSGATADASGGAAHITGKGNKTAKLCRVVVLFPTQIAMENDQTHYQGCDISKKVVGNEMDAYYMACQIHNSGFSEQSSKSCEIEACPSLGFDRMRALVGKNYDWCHVTISVHKQVITTKGKKPQQQDDGYYWIISHYS